MKQTKALIAGILASLAAPASIGMSVEYPRLGGSDLSRLRGDVQRVGRDFSSVMNRKNDGKANAPSSSKAA